MKEPDKIRAAFGLLRRCAGGWRSHYLEDRQAGMTTWMEGTLEQTTVFELTWAAAGEAGHA